MRGSALARGAASSQHGTRRTRRTPACRCRGCRRTDRQGTHRRRGPTTGWAPVRGWALVCTTARPRCETRRAPRCTARHPPHCGTARLSPLRHQSAGIVPTGSTPPAHTPLWCSRGPRTPARRPGPRAAAARAARREVVAARLARGSARGWAPVRGSALARRLALEGAPLVRASPTSPSPHLLSPYLPNPHLATKAVAIGVTVRAAAAKAVAGRGMQFPPYTSQSCPRSRRSRACSSRRPTPR